MRVILKPGAIFVLLAMMGVLGFLAFSHSKGSAAGPGSSAPPVAAGESLVKAVPDEFNSSDDAIAKREKIASTDRPGNNRDVFRYTIHKTPANFWEVSFSAMVQRPTLANEKLVFSVWARSATNNEALLLLEQGEKPFKAYLSQKVRLTPEWKEYVFPVTITEAYAQPQGTAARVHLGFAPGVVELAGLKVTPVP